MEGEARKCRMNTFQSHSSTLVSTVMIPTTLCCIIHIHRSTAVDLYMDLFWDLSVLPSGHIKSQKVRTAAAARTQQCLIGANNSDNTNHTDQVINSI